MKSFVFVTVFAVVAWARPDVSHLQNAYVPPVTSYGVPSSSVPSGSYLPSVPSSSSLNVFRAPFGSSQQSVSIVPNYQPSYQSSYQSNYYPSLQTQQQNIDVQLQPSAVEHRKSFYFYSAPEEPETRTRITIPIPPPQKRTNYIFVKAPVSRPQPVPVIVPQGGVDQKTVVYVLVRKNNQQVKPVVLDGPAPSPPQKPEVVFVNYDSAQQVHNLIHGTAHGEQHPTSSDVDTPTFVGHVQQDIAKSVSGGSSQFDINFQPQPASQAVEKVEGISGSESFGIGGGVQANYVGVGSLGSHSVEVSTAGPQVSQVFSGYSSTVVPSVRPTETVHIGGGDSSQSISFGPAGQSGPY
ncbi:uncharacterized protein LOC108737372 [Agrilus planipennis]|uniref:Uncharacterized protein LOC108737372 n=1 Tax=Agrilus planipennis TaxID=224129 RepID=A0A1W4WYV0_AGRPL|nr:uncharacterized protein LOC108737372 [Agrilus planipennis]